MSRLHHPRRFLTAVLLALIAAFGLASCGDDAPQAAPPPGPEAPVTETEPSTPHPIAFVKGLAAGIEAAGDPDALLLVYVARHHPT